MYVRDAKNREEVWLLDRLEEFHFEDSAFRSRDYVLGIDQRRGEKTGFGRLRIHRTEAGEICEVSNLGVLEEFRGDGFGAHILEQLVENASEEGFQELYALSPAPDYLEQFGFERIEPAALPDPLKPRFEDIKSRHPDAAPSRIDSDTFTVPRRLRRRFGEEEEEETESEGDEQAEDFGIDPKTATYKYDVN
ncbi:GNAT family N-acetyltransferase [Halodesulfurarchaeum sp.]|uniref:GNAT family N-acetyltransferase n=1 Tax=Halodesulfurarchaeum sp. TaxID=1980530 RepID=UPI002FC30DF8